MPTLPDPPSLGDWASFIAFAAAQRDHELDVSTMQPGDLLQVATTHTLYTLRFTGPRDALLTTDRPDRPSGPVRLMGCTYGSSSSTKPNQLFCGGNLEFTREGGRFTCTTTTIRGLQLIRRKAL